MAEARVNPLPAIPGSIIEFARMFPDDKACAAYMERVRWPDGFVCPKCGVQAEPYRLVSRPGKLECRSCKYQASVTAGTIMHQTHLALTYWFWAAFLMSTQTPGLSTLQFRKQAGIKRYETAYMLLRKLRAGMSRPAQDRIGGEHPVELDVAFIGGATKGLGRGVTKKAMVLIAVEVREGEPPKNIREAKEQRFYAGRVRMRKISNRTAETINKFARDWLQPGSVILTDDDSSYVGLGSNGFVHEPMVTKKNKQAIESWVPLVHLVISNLKAWLQGTFHGAVRKHHLQEYLNEYMFRFNRRFWPMSAFRTLLQIGTEVDPVTYRAHYDGTAFVRSNPSTLPEELEGLEERVAHAVAVVDHRLRASSGDYEPVGP